MYASQGRNWQRFSCGRRRNNRFRLLRKSREFQVMALRRGPCQWISDQPSTTFGLALAEPSRLRAPQALELDPEPPLPFGWEKCFDLQTGVIFFKDPSTGIRTSKDPRVHSKLQQQEQLLKDVDSQPWRNLSRSLDTAASDASGDKREEWMDRAQRFRGFEASALDEKVSKWKNYSSKKFPPLLSLKSTDSLPSLELSLRLESPDARDSSSLQLTTYGDKPGGLNEKAGHVKLEQLEQCRKNFLGPNHNMGPFPSNSIKVKEEITSASLCWGDQSPVVRNLSTFPVSTSSRREGIETSATSPHEQPEFRDLLGPKYAMGPFSSSNEGHVVAEPMPSSMDQLGGACTLDKVLMALERTQSHYETALNNYVSMKSGNQKSNSLRLASGISSKPKLSSTPLLLQPPSSTKVSSAAASLSPTTSDASSALSSKSSLHSSTSVSVMSFQGEDLDDLGGHGSSVEGKLRSSLFPSSTATDPKVDDGEAPITLVAVGCMSCHMFVMLSKDNPSCPRCGKTGLLDISPPRKRQRLENSSVDAESRRCGDTSSPS